MPSDRSRPPDPASDAYTGVAYQQGRVTLDRDYNAQREILDHRDAATTLDLNGPCGTPDDGFAVTRPVLFLPRLPTTISSLGASTPALRAATVATTATLATTPIATPIATPIIPPVISPIVSSPPADAYNLLIRSGTMYLGGVRVEWPGEPGGGAAEYSYYDQPDWLSPDPPAAPQTEIVFLLADEHEISAAEDPNLYDVALGGPDTTQRWRLQRTVHRQAVSATSCTPAWQALLTAWQAVGWGFDATTMRRVPQVRLQAAFTTPAGTTDPCDPIATGGYLGAENQLIRIKWAPTTPGATSGTLIWGFDDASFIYRASSDQTGTHLTLTRSPPDAYHFPGAGQYVEVLRTTALVGTTASQQAEDDGTIVPRCVAEQTGFVTTLAVAYDPTTLNQTLVLSQPLPAAYITSAEPLFVRIWQGGGAMGPTGGTMELVDPVANASTGATVTVTVPGGTAIAPGSFWMMALRPGAPLQVLPASLAAAPQPPDGPRSWACPLAVVEWPTSSTDPVIHDCRVQFDNLITLTKRPAGCCTVSMGPGDVTIDYSVQTAINSIIGPGTLCLAQGTYPLLTPLLLGPAQAGLTIVAENGATLTAASGSEAAFGAGMIVVAGAGNVTLQGLTLIPPAVAVAPSLFSGLANLSRIALPAQQEGLALMLRMANDNAQNMRTMIGMWAAGSPSLTVEDCTVQFTAPPVASPPSISAVFGIGLLVGGACAQLAVRGCVFNAAAMPATQTVGLLQSTGFVGPGNFVLPSEVEGGMQGAIGCLAAPYLQNFLAAPSSPPPTPVSSPQPISILGTINPILTETAAGTALSSAALATSSPILGAVIAGAPTVATAAVPAVEAVATPTAVSATPAVAATTSNPALSTTDLNVRAPVAVDTSVLSGVAATTTATIAPSTLTVAQPVTSNLFNQSVGLNLLNNITVLQLDTEDVFTTVADLSGAVFEDNIFDSVILAISATAMLDRVRVQDNTVVSSSGGIWLRPIDQPRFAFTTAVAALTPTVTVQDPVVAGDSMWLKLVLMQQETFLTWLLSLLLPLPTNAAQPVFAAPEGGTTVRVTGNTVAALGALASGAAWGTPALAVVTGTYVSAVDIGPSLIVTDNRLQSRTQLSYPAAVLAISGRLAATGNLISNEQLGSPPTSTSLEIFPNDNGGTGVQTSIAAPRIVVTGNVLEGTSNLSVLLRTDAAGLPAPFNTWLPFNASA
jgi:hypothetical protein